MPAPNLSRRATPAWLFCRFQKSVNATDERPIPAWREPITGKSPPAYMLKFIKTRETKSITLFSNLFIKKLCCRGLKKYLYLLKQKITINFNKSGAMKKSSFEFLTLLKRTITANVLIKTNHFISM